MILCFFPGNPKEKMEYIFDSNCFFYGIFIRGHNKPVESKLLLDTFLVRQVKIWKRMHGNTHMHRGTYHHRNGTWFHDTYIQACIHSCKNGLIRLWLPKCVHKYIPTRTHMNSHACIPTYIPISCFENCLKQRLIRPLLQVEKILYMNFVVTQWTSHYIVHSRVMTIIRQTTVLVLTWRVSLISTNKII